MNRTRKNDQQIGLSIFRYLIFFLLLFSSVNMASAAALPSYVQLEKGWSYTIGLATPERVDQF